MPYGDRLQPVEGLNSGILFFPDAHSRTNLPEKADSQSLLGSEKKEADFSLDREEKMLRPSVYFLNGVVCSVLKSRITLNFNVC